MTDRRRTGISSHREPTLTAFHAEVTRLMSLSWDAFADLDPDALVPLVATIRAIPRATVFRLMLDSSSG
jgi:hypothetical protein